MFGNGKTGPRDPISIRAYLRTDGPPHQPLRNFLTTFRFHVHEITCIQIIMPRSSILNLVDYSLGCFLIRAFQTTLLPPTTYSESKMRMWSLNEIAYFEWKSKINGSMLVRDGSKRVATLIVTRWFVDFSESRCHLFCTVLPKLTDLLSWLLRPKNFSISLEYVTVDDIMLVEQLILQISTYPFVIRHYTTFSGARS